MLSEEELHQMDEDANAWSNDCPRLVRILTNEVRHLQREVVRLQGWWEAAEQRIAESADMVLVGQITATLAMERDEAIATMREARQIACDLYGDLGVADYYGAYTDWACRRPEWLVDQT